MFLILIVIEPFAKLPAGLPSLLMRIRRPGAVENSSSMYRAEISQCVAESPAFIERSPQSMDFIVL